MVARQAGIPCHWGCRRDDGHVGVPIGEVLDELSRVALLVGEAQEAASSGIEVVGIEAGGYSRGRLADERHARAALRPWTGCVAHLALAGLHFVIVRGSVRAGVRSVDGLYGLDSDLRQAVAVALSQAAMAKFKPADIEQIKSLVSAAVGADPTRGDTVAVVVRNFDVAPPLKVNFWEQPWFATVLHNGVALLAVLLVLLMGVRPLIKALKRPPMPPAPTAGTAGEAALVAFDAMKDPVTGAIDAEALGRQVGIAQRLVAEKPDSAALALRQMLQPQTESGG